MLQFLDYFCTDMGSLFYEYRRITKFDTQNKKILRFVIDQTGNNIITESYPYRSTDEEIKFIMPYIDENISTYKQSMKLSDASQSNITDQCYDQKVQQMKLVMNINFQTNTVERYTVNCNNKKFGDYRQWDFNTRQLICKKKYYNDVLSGNYHTWYNDGTPLCSCKYKYGHLYDKYISWYPNGIIKEIKYYRYNSSLKVSCLNGEYKLFYPNGKLQLLHYYNQCGQIIGYAREFYDDESLKINKFYQYQVEANVDPYCINKPLSFIKTININVCEKGELQCYFKFSKYMCIEYKEVIKNCNANIIKHIIIYESSLTEKHIHYYTNGNISLSYYITRNGFYIGPYYEFYEDGSPKITMIYDHKGKCVSDIMIYSPNGQIQSRYFINADSGQWFKYEEYDENNQLQKCIFRFEGYYEFLLYDNNNIHIHGYYDNNMDIIGLYEEFDNEGHRVKQLLYDNPGYDEVNQSYVESTIDI